MVVVGIIFQPVPARRSCASQRAIPRKKRPSKPFIFNRFQPAREQFVFH